MELEEEVVVVGGGIAGLATALALNRVGIRTLVLEKSPHLRTTGAALYLFPNAWLALDALRVSHKLAPFYPPLTAGSITDLSTGAVHQIFSSGRRGRRAQVVHRKALLEALAEELPQHSIKFCSNVTSIHADDVSDMVISRLEDGTTIKSKALIGCDGLHSVVAQWLGLSAPVGSGRSAFRGLAVYPGGHGLETRNPHPYDTPLMFRNPWNIVVGRLRKGSITVAGDAMHPMTPDLGQGGGSALEDAVVLGRHMGKYYKYLMMGRVLDGYVEERKWRAAGLVMGSYVAGWVQQSGEHLVEEGIERFVPKVLV